MHEFEPATTIIDEEREPAEDYDTMTAQALAALMEARPAHHDPVVLRRGRIVRLPVLGRLVPLLRLQMGVALVLLNLADVLLTKALLGVGAIEANPVMAPLMPGTLAPIGAKTLIPAFAALLLVMCPPESKLADRAVATVLGVYVGIVLWNGALLAHLTL